MYTIYKYNVIEYFSREHENNVLVKTNYGVRIIMSYIPLRKINNKISSWLLHGCLNIRVP